MIANISYNARYVKYRGVKKASFLRFGFFQRSVDLPPTSMLFYRLFAVFHCLMHFICVLLLQFFFRIIIIFYNGFYRTHMHSLSACSILFQARIFYIIVIVSVLEPFRSFYFSVHDHSFVLF